MPKRPAIVSRHRQSITPATRFRQLPVWLSKADIVAYFKISKIDAQALIDSADRRCQIDGVQKISKYQLQDPFYVDLIDIMRRNPSRPSIRRLFRAAIEKIARDPTHPQNKEVLKEFARYQLGGAR